MTVSQAERTALCDLLTELGPDAPTLCEGWQTRDLAAHLAIREHRADAALMLVIAPGAAGAVAGILLKPFATHTKQVQDRYAQRPWPELVDLVRAGAPWFWPTNIPAMDRLANTVEFYIHHEDVRRARPGWVPREPDAERDAALWAEVARAGKLSLRRSPVGLVLRRRETRSSGSSRLDRGAEVVIKRGPNPVVATGEPGELLLFAFGRDENRVEFAGDRSSVAAVRAANRGW